MEHSDVATSVQNKMKTYWVPKYEYTTNQIVELSVKKSRTKLRISINVTTTREGRSENMRACVCVRIAQEETRKTRYIVDREGSPRYPPPWSHLSVSIPRIPARRDFTSPRRLTRERRSHFISLVGWHGYIDL